MDKDPKDILFQDIKKDICAFLHIFDTKFQARSYEHYNQEKKASYKRYKNDAAFYASVNVLAHAIFKLLDKKYIIFDKKDSHKRLCNYFKCSDSNDKQYPECEEQTTGRCQAIGVICALCKGE